MSNKVKFDGEEGSIELERITAKKNFASSMQSHKMGATYMFDTLHKYLGEEVYPDLPNEVNGNVAVKQLPVYAFLKTKIEGTEQYNYKYIGNFTVGADKGDKGFFGINNEAVKNTAIRLEGTDHIKGAGYNYPWEVNGVKNIRYNDEKEALCIVTGSDRTAWSAVLEQSHCGNKKSEADIEAYLEQEFKPAYDCAYHANPLIVGVSMTLDEINADIEAFKKLRRTTDDRPYSYCEFWIDGEYDLYYLNLERNRYEKNGVNLYSELSASERTLVDNATSLDEKNQVFINFRINRFQNEAPKYWHINDGLFQLNFLLLIAASDNGEKNMYPYKLTPLSEGGRWMFFQDDLDSIKKTDNQGQDTKPYSVELHDFTDETKNAYVFKGEDNAFFQALELAFPDRMMQMGRDILQAMYNLSPKGTKTLDKLMGFFDEFFFSRAQEYFTKSAYNNDAEYAYEEAWNNKDYVASVDIHPLAQSMGDHYTIERAWVEKRMLYLMSKYGFGGYSSYEDSALGIISVRTQDPQGFTLTPAIDSFPTILGGQAQTSKAERRIKAGEAIKLAAVGGGNTNTYIVGADWLSDIGDLKDLSIDPSSVVVLSVASKRLRRLKVGDENAEEVTSYLATLSVQQCDSMETVDARNLKTLVGTVDLSKCPRLIEALFGGTNATGVVIAAGSKIEHLQLPDSVTAIDLRDTKFLDNFEYGTLANLGFLRLENVPSLNAFAMLKEAYNADGSQLKDIRLVGWTHDGDATDFEMIANIGNNKDKDGNDHQYNGIDADGAPTSGKPVLEGKINLNAYIYEDSAEIVKQQFPAIEFTPFGYYIKFADPEVLRVLLSKMTTDDGIGITEEQAANLTNINNLFWDNSVIRSFDELGKFGVRSISGTFYNCPNLQSVDLSKITYIDSGTFYQCASLEEVDLSSVTTLKSSYGRAITFGYCTSLKAVKGLNITAIPTSCFTGCTSLTDIDLNNIKTVSQSGFDSCTSLVSVNLDNCETLGDRAFIRCSALVNVGDNCAPNTIGAGCFSGCPKLKKINLKNIKTLTGTGNIVVGGAFYQCEELEDVGDVSNIEYLEMGAFSYCKKLTKLNFSSKLTYIGQSIFSSCSALRNVGDLSNVTNIGNSAFSGCSSLTEVSISNVVSIGGDAFAGCKSLIIDDLNLPKLESLNSTSFQYVKLRKISNLGTITSVPQGCFVDCSELTEVTLPSTLTSIARDSFLRCTSLSHVKMLAETPPSLDATAFNRTDSTFVIYVPDASVEAYKTATNWSAYADRIKGISEMPTE